MDRKIYANYLEHLKRTMEDRAQEGKQASIDEILTDYAERTGLNEMQKRALIRRVAMLKVAADFTKKDLERDIEQVEQGLAPPSILPGIQPGSKKDKKLRRSKDPEVRRQKPDNTEKGADGVNYDEDNDLHMTMTMNLMQGSVRQRRRIFAQTAEKIQDKITTVENKLVDEFLVPGSSLENPQWDKSKSWKDRIALESKLHNLNVELQTLEQQQEFKDYQQSPEGKTRKNNGQFAKVFDKIVGAKDAADRAERIQDLSTRGLQNVFDKAVAKSDKFYKDSQGYSEEHGDYVKCVMCNWINPANPSIIPASHLQTHAEELDAKNPGTLISNYLDSFPEASLYSREKELANLTQQMIATATGSKLAQTPFIATSHEKAIDFSDQALEELVKSEIRGRKIPSTQISYDDLTARVVQDIKTDLAEEFPSLYSASEQIGSLEQRNIPFSVFQTIVSTSLATAAEEYDGMILRRKVVEPKQQKQQEDAVDFQQQIQWTEPTEEEIEQHRLIPVNLSVGSNSCWNCGQQHVTYAKSEVRAANSVSCPSCGVYRELPVNWSCPSCKEVRRYVVRDPNADASGSKHYEVHCDLEKIGNGSQAVGNSKYVFLINSPTKKFENNIPAPSEDFIDPIATGDSVSSDQYGIGKVVLVGSGNRVFVDFPENPKTVKLEDALGEAVYLHTNRPGWSGYYLIEDIAIDQEEIKLTMRGENGQVFVREYPASEALNDIPIATETTQERLNKINTAQNRNRRLALLKKIANAECEGSETIKVLRYETAPTRAQILKNRIKRARLIDRTRRSN